MAEPRPFAAVDDAATREGEQLAACRRGDADAFAWVFERYRDHVFSVAYHLCGDATEAGDITQDVFVKLIRRIGQYRGDARFSTWLYRVAFNTYLDRRRAVRRTEPLSEAAAEPIAPTQERAATRAQTRDHVRAALHALDDRFREPLVLRFVSEMSYKEIADVLKIPPGTVASRLSRGLEDLGRRLVDAGVVENAS